MPFSTLSATDGLYSGWSALLCANQPVLLPQELAHVTAAVLTSEHCFRILLSPLQHSMFFSCCWRSRPAASSGPVAAERAHAMYDVAWPGPARQAEYKKIVQFGKMTLSCFTRR